MVEREVLHFVLVLSMKDFLILVANVNPLVIVI